MMIPKKIIYNAAYVEHLKEIGKYKKAQSFMIYLHDINLHIYQTSRTYAPVWGIGKTTAYNWIEDFNTEIAQSDREMF